MHAWLMRFAMALVLVATTAALAAPAQVPYLGHLTHQDGTPFNGTLAVEAALYGQAEGGAPLWGPATLAGPEGTGLTVVEGLLAFTLGADGSPPVDAALLADAPGGLWLAVTVVEDPAGEAQETPLAPRQPFLSAPYALQAADALSLGGVAAAQYATWAALKPVCTSGAYADLSGRPDLALYALNADLASVAFSGQYMDLAGLPQLKAVATSGEYSDLAHAPDLSVYATNESVGAMTAPLQTAIDGKANTVHGHAWGDLTGVPAAFPAAAHRHPWAELDSLPADLADGDDDALAGLPCTDGQMPWYEGGWKCAEPPQGALDTLASLHCDPQQVAKWSGTAWGCAADADTDTTLTEAQVDAMVANNGFALATDLTALDAALKPVAKSGAYADLTGKPALSTVALTGAYADLTGVPATFAPSAHGHGWAEVTGKPATYPPEAHSQDWSTLTNKPTAFTPATHGHPWGDLSGVPSGLADGDNDQLAGLTCADGKVVKRVGGAWACGDDVDTNTTYTGADFAVSLQSCESGKVAVAIDVAGRLVCEVAGGSLPADGLVQVSNGTLTNFFAGTFAAQGLPQAIGQLANLGVTVERAGGLRDLSVSVGFTHPYCPEVEVRLLPPGDSTGVRLLKPGGATGANCSYNHVFLWGEALPDGGKLSDWAGREQAGTWTLRVTDTLVNGNEATGRVTAYSLTTDFLSSGMVGAPYDVLVEGNLTVRGALGACDGDLCARLTGLEGDIAAVGASYAPLQAAIDAEAAARSAADAAEATARANSDAGLTATNTAQDATLTAQAASIAALQAELWCLKQCDPQRIGDCKDRTCNGTTHVCTQAGSLPDGTACQGGAGRCKTGACCIPATCYVLGAACGTIDDGCGGVLSCGTCQSVGAVCLDNQCCQPKTCADLGKTCGTWDDQCGGTTASCGTCAANQTCSGSGACQCTLTCGGTCCPALTGYTAACNTKNLCEYASTDQTGWKARDTWIWIPPGSFQMGSPSGESGRGADEGPVHTVTFASGYYIGKYEVTTATYAACQAASPGTCTAPSTADWDGAGWGPNTTSGRSDHPQNGLTWDQAGAVCTWLGGRLPSEAQWEYAATGPTHRVYPWGDTPAPSCAANLAVYDEQGDGTRPWACDSCTSSGCSGTKPEGTKAAGMAWSGALDMAGNVWEWCQDWYHSDYNGATTDGSAWVSPTGSARVCRGGGFHHDASSLRSADRGDDAPSSRYANFGVRCSRP
jgi:formylglycine-generating enzyme required for sulfatase activity/subtilisin-like proprotein convertase family protein